MPFRLFHRSKNDNDSKTPSPNSSPNSNEPKRSRSGSASRLRKRLSQPWHQEPMPGESRQSLAYEDTRPNQSPQMGSTPLFADGRTSRDTSRSNTKRFSSPAVSAPYSPTPMPEWPLPTRQTPDLTNEFERLNLRQGNESLARDTPDRSAMANGYARKTSASHPVQSNGLPRHADLNRVDPYGDFDSDADVYHDSNAHQSDMPAALNTGRLSKEHTVRSVPQQEDPFVADTPREDALVQTHTRQGSVSRKPLSDDAKVANFSGSSHEPVLDTHQNGHSLKHSSGHDDLTRVSHDTAPTYSSSSDDRDLKPTATSYPREEYDPYLVRDSAEPISLEGIVDLSNTVDTTVHEKWAPAVTHNTIHTHHHHIREEVVTREIHTHDIYHRILPVIDIQVLPARHFILDPTRPGERIEISESQIPGRTGSRTDWVIAETVSRMTPTTVSMAQARAACGFSARKFSGDEGDRSNWFDESGVERSRQTWIHPPTLDTGAMLAGQSVPFHFGSERASMDGIRPDLS